MIMFQCVVEYGNTMRFKFVLEDMPRSWLHCDDRFILEVGSGIEVIPET